MIGLMEQIKPENRHVYDVSHYPLTAYQTLASNIRHLLTQEGKLKMEDFIKLNRLIESEDIESVKLSIILMETITGEKYTKDESVESNK